MLLTSRTGEIQVLSETWRTGEAIRLELRTLSILIGGDFLPFGIGENIGSRSSIIVSFCY